MARPHFAITATSVAVSLLLAGVPAWAGAQTAMSEDDWTVRRVEWQGTLDGAEVLAVVNELGDLRARAAAGDEVAWLAVIQHPPGDPAPPTVEVERDGKRLSVTVRDPGAAAQRADEPRRRVDLTVFVPAAVVYEARTGDGLIEAKRLDCDVVASSRRGEVRIVTRGTVRAYSERGALNVTLVRPDWRAPPTLETVTGPIELWLPQDADATVAVHTGGLITTDYSLRVDYPLGSALRRAIAILGDGSRRVEIESARGDVRLLRSPLRPNPNQSKER